MIRKGMVGRLGALAAVAAIVASACTSSAATTGPGGSKTYTIGYSNGGGVGNGFREEQVCTAKAAGQDVPGDHRTSP